MFPSQSSKQLEISQTIMFCCARKESHRGEVVTGVCLESECARAKNQLSCILCLQEQHQGHSTTSMRKIVPELLEAHSEKLASEAKLQRLMDFVVGQFGYEFISGQTTTRENLIERVQQLLLSLKKQVEATNEEFNKMKAIFKNINKTTTSQLITKHASIRQTEHEEESPGKHNPSAISPVKSKLANTAKSNLFSPQTGNSKAEIDTFSISAKHPYLHLSPDLRTVTKTSHSGHRFAVVGAKAFAEGEEELTLRIDNSASGNIMVGVCHESIVRQKDFSNCYGISSGTYIIGQNGSNPTTAISFHHRLAVMNRKEIVGWNFQNGDQIVVGINFQEELVYFRRQNKGAHLQFTMKLIGESKSQQSHPALGLKLVVLLQSEGDQVTILQS